MTNKKTLNKTKEKRYNVQTNNNKGLGIFLIINNAYENKVEQYP